MPGCGANELFTNVVIKKGVADAGGKFTENTRIFGSYAPVAGLGVAKDDRQ